MTAPDTFLVHADELLPMDQAPLHDAGVLVEDGVVTWMGSWRRRPKRAKRADFPLMRTGVLTPGWIEPHAHLFAPIAEADLTAPETDRARAFARAHAELPKAALAEAALTRALGFVRRGVTHVHFVVGLWDDVDTAHKMLGAIRQADADAPCTLTASLGIGYTGAPPEGDLGPLLERAGDVTVFCDPQGLDAGQATQALDQARAAGATARIALGLTGATGGLHLAQLGSATHLDHASPAEEAPPILTPLTSWTRGQWDTLPAARDREDAALSTGLHPVYATHPSPGLAASFACSRWGWSPERALQACTARAAHALGREDLGTIKVGQVADLAMFACPSAAHIPHAPEDGLVEGVVWRGVFVYWTEAEDV